MDDDTQREIDRINGNVNGLYELVSDLRDENEDLRRRIAELEEIVDPDPEQVSDQIKKGQKIRKIRKALYRDALNRDGKAFMEYDEVMALFENDIAPSYSYDLMEQASEMEGFTYGHAGANNEGQKQIRVDSASVNDKTLVHSVKKDMASNPA
jgi:hypothetical protein